ncbi:MAG: hypothetical protein Q4G09_03895 [Clostridia bacterium]|nr:hypothetical protein [Clostridia bacterium]
MKDKEDAQKILEKYGQEHLLSQYDKLSDIKKKELLNQILNIDFTQINNLYNQTTQQVQFNKDIIEPIKYIDKEALTMEDKKYYTTIGEQEIKNGKLAVVTMAGGQGTRLRTQWSKRNIYIKCRAKSKVFI